MLKKRRRFADETRDEEKTENLVPLRDTSLLFASPSTVSCAYHCVPCAYKVGLFDVALDKEFCNQVPNQRPEQCRRASTTMQPDSGIILGFQQGMSILTVGDGDLSYSLALARILRPKESNSVLSATSYEDEETLRNVYPNFDRTRAELEYLGATIRYKVDATRLKETLSPCLKKKYHRICWNFPCTAVSKGQDGQNDEMERNKDLIRGFVSSCRSMLSPVDGEIHMCHKTKPPYNQWKLEQVVLDNATEAGTEVYLDYAGRVVLDRYNLPPYTPRKALDRKSFPCHDACFFIFRQKDRNVDKKAPSFLPTVVASKGSVQSSTVPVTPAIILEIRASILRNARPRSQARTKKRRKRSK